MKITTKTGDKGETSLFGGKRVSKASGFIEIVGYLDELQSYIGWARCALEKGKELELLDRIQDDIYRMMSIVGFERKVPKGISEIGESDVEVLDKFIDDCQDSVQNLNEFIRLGTTEEAARLHVTRSFCRRVERRLVGAELGGAEMILKYINRLSDLLFLLAYRHEQTS